MNDAGDVRIAGRSLEEIRLGATGRVHSFAGVITPARLAFEATNAKDFEEMRLLWWVFSPPWLQAREIGAIVAEGLFGWLS